MFRHFRNFPSTFVSPRQVDVWLPPGYGRQRRQRFPVLYMHDGQNLFNPKTSYTQIAWGVDEALSRLIDTGEARAAIVVGVWNTPQRFAEYMPQKAAARLLDTEEGRVWLAAGNTPLSDAYLQFLVTELKPFIDAAFRTLPGLDDTLIMGSSMGGLISAYAVCEYPDVFGGAGCVSTHWPAGNGIMIEYLAENLPDPAKHRFYFDYGAEGVDAPYEPLQRQVDDVMRAAGYEEGRNWVTRKFPGADHSERAWRARVDVPLRFLLAGRTI